MSDPLAPTVENKLNDLNKKIAEIKKKIQLSEGQRKANFEEYEAKKHEYAKKIAALKQSIKELYVEYANVQNNEGKSESKIRASRESSAHGKKRNLGEAINKMQEDNVRLRKKHDLIKYQRKKRQQKLHSLLDEYGKLMSNKTQKIFKRKTENPSRNVSWNNDIVADVRAYIRSLVSFLTEDCQTGSTFGTHQNDANQSEHSANEIPIDVLRFETKVRALRIFVEKSGRRDKGAGERDKTPSGKSRF
ncbi:hypothetical protein K0M31_013392 [Melipona bicolor]|uniref:Uncharacterized protein n=1 Tax=Melipona bicolor TaxID=60889 RepID=A0AA40FIN0_9HYME|nr:hypothetical protein K0M31_013392 [Melipona bicolor]